MKRITAYIKPHKLSAVALALHSIEGMTGMSVIDARGFGRGRAKDVSHAIREDLVDFIPNARLEIVCTDEHVQEIVEAIREAAHTGLRGDGKIYISAVEGAIRISTGDRGLSAV